ncbi:hypothetical protein ACIQJW_26800 [Streptomyces californicus]|uniref:hypothetical protein n=1 Tax=Streptomyces californicus TaxID=67351 RepID=UPI00383026BE
MATIGDIVAYRMSEDDCLPWVSEWAEDPRLAYRMNLPSAGMQFPALVVADNGGGDLNLRVFLDSRDAGLWATHRVEGTGPGTWALQADTPPPTDPGTETPPDPDPVPPVVPDPEPSPDPTPTTTDQEV